ncbi:MAG: tetratricopeptide repeat protein, partial [Raineya sp.]|nr:tetratricopeptide repeat protein [Raineya sp.]
MKKLLLLSKIFILSIHLENYAQSFSKIQSQFGELYQKMTQEAKNKNYAQACAFGSEAEPLAEKALEGNQEKIASFYYNLAGFCAAAGEAEKAEKAYKQCITIRKKILGVQHPDYIKTVDKLAQFYTQTNRQAEADKLLAQLKKDQTTASTTQNNKNPDTQNSANSPQGTDSPEFAKTLTNQAITQIKQGKYKEAESNLLRAIAIYQKNNIQNTDFATASDAYGIVLVSLKGNYKEATPHFENAYNIRKRELGENHQLTQETTFNLAVCYNQTRQVSKAQTLFESALQYFEKNQANSPKYLETLIALGNSYLETKNITKAEPLLQKAYQIEQKNPQKSPFYIDLMNDLARLEFIRKNYHVAENYYRLVVEHYSQSQTKNSKEYAEALINLGNNLKAQNKNVEAEKNYQQATQILKGLKQEKSAEYLQISMHLAELQAERGDYEKAIKAYQQLLPQLKEVTGENHPYYWQSLVNLADCYTALKKFKEARPYYEQLINNPSAQSSPDYPRWLINLGAFYYETGKYQEAEKLFAQALQGYETQIQGAEVDYIETLEILANLYKNQGRYTEAEKLYRKATEFCRKQFGEMHFTYTSLQNNLAKLYKSLGRYEEAETIYKQALARFGKQDENSTAYAQLLNDYAVLYRDAGKFKEAEPLFVKSLAIFQKQTGEKSAEYASVLQNWAMLEKRMGRFSEAISNFQKCLSIRKEVLGELHPDYVVTLNSLANLYKKAGN